MITSRKVRDGVTRMSRCGMRSLTWCRQNRYVCAECEDCTLIYRYCRHKNKEEDGVMLRHCSRCGMYRPIKYFSRRINHMRGKTYVGYRSVCNFCLSEQYYEKKNAALAAKK